MTENPISEESLLRRLRNRRDFLKEATLAAGGLALGPGLLEACGPTSVNTRVGNRVPQPRSGASITLLQWTSFVQAADDELKRQAKEWGDANGVNVTIQTVASNELQPKTAAAVAAGAGPDIIQMQYGWPHLYANACEDVTNEVTILLNKLGKPHDANQVDSKVGNVYRAIPYSLESNAWSYRTDLFAQAGVGGFPATWDEILEVAPKLAAIKAPIAHTVGHATADAAVMWNPVLWSFGAFPVAADGRTVTINSSQTEAALNWAIRARDAGVAWHADWLDPDNNAAFAGGKISATLNGISIYLKEQTTFHHYDKVMYNAPMPSGPQGNFTLNLDLNHAVMTWSKEKETAKAFLLHIMDKVNYDRWMTVAAGYNAGPFEAFDDHPVWNDPKIKAFRDVVLGGKWIGYPGPPSRQATLAANQFVVPDMVAKAVATGDVRGAIAEAESRLKQIYSTP